MGMVVNVQLIGADQEKTLFAAVSTRTEGGFFVVTEHFEGGKHLTTRYPVSRIAWVKEETDGNR